MSPAVAFMSYARSTDFDARISDFRQLLIKEVLTRLRSLDFTIFLDYEDIQAGQEWEKRIEDALDQALLFIPVITPRFFGSQNCRKELRLFQKHEERLGRDDLIIPVYYIEDPDFDDPVKRAQDPVMNAIGRRQLFDWRRFRYEVTDDALQELAKLAKRISSIVSEIIGPSLPAEPETLIVDREAGPIRSISEAIRVASWGARIVVHPGIYQEGVTIDKPVQILGNAASREKVVVQAVATRALSFSTTMGRVANISLEQLVSCE